MKVYIVCEGITESDRPDYKIPNACSPYRVYEHEIDACIRCEKQAIWSFGKENLVCDTLWLYHHKDNPRHKVFIHVMYVE